MRSNAETLSSEDLLDLVGIGTHGNGRAGAPVRYPNSGAFAQSGISGSDWRSTVRTTRLPDSSLNIASPFSSTFLTVNRPAFELLAP